MEKLQRMHYLGDCNMVGASLGKAAQQRCETLRGRISLNKDALTRADALDDTAVLEAQLASDKAQLQTLITTAKTTASMADPARFQLFTERQWSLSKQIQQIQARLAAWATALEVQERL